MIHPLVKRSRKPQCSLRWASHLALMASRALVDQQGGDAVLDKLQNLFTNCREKETLPPNAVIVQEQGRKIRLFKLPRHHSTLYCMQNLGSRLAEQVQETSKKACVDSGPQRDDRHDLCLSKFRRNAENRTCSFRRPNQGI